MTSLTRRHFLLRHWLLGLLCVSLAFSQAAFADPVDDFLNAELLRQKIPGMAVAVIRDGKIVKAAGYGIANLEHNVPVTPDTVFQIGSVGKQFTAGAVMLLVQDGKIALDSPVSKYLDFAPETWKDVTVRYLLTHTSGIPDYTGIVDLSVDASAETTAKKVTSKPLDFTPGTKWDYSNTNYLLLGVLLEKASGKFYGDILKERVFSPLGMTTARINTETELVANRASGYQLRGGSWKNQGYVPPTVNTYADGSVIMSVRDMAKWDIALYTDKPFSKTTREQMWTPAKLTDGKTTDYGFGWQIGQRNGHRFVSHSGAWQGFTAVILRYLDDKLTVVVLTNRAGANPSSIAVRTAGMYLPEVMPKAAPPPAPEPKITELVKTVIQEITDNKLRRERFTKEMWDAVSGTNTANFATLIRSLGPLREVTITEKKMEGEERIYRVRIVFAQEQASVVLTLTKDDIISGLLFLPE